MGRGGKEVKHEMEPREKHYQSGQGPGDPDSI